MSDPIKILLVDDEARNLDALEVILDDPGYLLLRARDADTALRLLLENAVAAIVLDIKMPGLSGVELARIIKGTKRFRQIPIVFLTAYLVEDQDVLAGYGAGAVDYLTKPVNPQILRHKVAVFADLFRKTRALAELNEHLEARVQERTAELERSEAALRAADRQKDLFLGTLAHELRNPLAPLRTGLDFLRKQPDQPPPVVSTLTAMNRQLAHVVRLVDDLLDVSRITRGALEMRKEHVALASVIDHALETTRPFFARRDQSASLNLGAPITAFLDATRVAQIVGNLLHNASKYSPSGATIRVEMERVDDTAVVRVIDEGSGIAENEMDRAFEMFTRIERSSHGVNEGLGVGLALSRQIAVLHGGTLVGTSAGEGKGSIFTLTLPLGAPSPAAGVPVEAPKGEASTASLRIVLVEDNDDSAEMMAVWLGQLGHQVRVARTGTDGETLIAETRPDVALCDIGLPGIDGVELCRRIVARLTPPPVMIALTGWGMEGDRRRTSDAGFAYHLVKPVAPEELRVVLERIASSRREG